MRPPRPPFNSRDSACKRVLVLKVTIALMALWFVAKNVSWRDAALLADGRAGWIQARQGGDFVLEIEGGSIIKVNGSEIVTCQSGLRTLFSEITAPTWVIVLLVPICASTLFWLRWHTLLRWTGARFDWSWSGRAWIRSQIIGLLPLGSVGADSYRVYAVRDAFEGIGTPLGIAAMERLAGLAALVAIGFTGLCLQWEAHTPTDVGLILAGGVFVCLAALMAIWAATRWNPRAGPRLQRIRKQLDAAVRPFKAVAESPGRLICIVGLSLLGQSTSVLAYLVVDWLMGWNTSPAIYLIAVPIVTLAQMLPLHVAGVGITELGIWYFLSQHSTRSASEAVLLANVVRFATWCSFAFLGTLFWSARIFGSRSTACDGGVSRPAARQLVANGVGNL